MKNIILLGSTGSIGTQTLDVLKNQPQIGRVKAIAAYGNRLELLKEQILEFHPEAAAVFDEAKAAQLKQELSGTGIKVLSGMDGLLELVSMKDTDPSEPDIVVTAMVGMIGLAPTVQAIRSHKTIALANKETLVCAGALIMDLAKKEGVRILPVDSEHSAIFQCLDGRGPETIGHILLTASGGPFRGYTAEQLEAVTLEQALKHPNWAMGAKITIDSATMMNKGLEMIEARWLFGVSADQITVVVHPQSILHSAVEFTNGSVIAQMGVPDMRLPIQEALEYPKRGNRVVPMLDLMAKGTLTFERPDESVFRSIPMAREALRKGGLFPAVYNAANEQAVQAFRDRKIGFTDIYKTVAEALESYDKDNSSVQTYTLQDIYEIQDRNWL